MVTIADWAGCWDATSMEFGGGDEYEVGVAKRIAAEHTCTKLPQCMPTCPLMRHLVSKFHHRDILPPQHQAQGVRR